jgi:hypothetical protein
MMVCRSIIYTINNQRKRQLDEYEVLSSILFQEREKGEEEKKRYKCTRIDVVDWRV